jgi:hypothetical protein
MANKVSPSVTVSDAGADVADGDTWSCALFQMSGRAAAAARASRVHGTGFDGTARPTSQSGKGWPCRPVVGRTACNFMLI